MKQTKRIWLLIKDLIFGLRMKGETEMFILDTLKYQF